MDPSPDPVEQALSRRYPVERILGKGALSTVYLATDPKHGRHVAVKVLDPRLAAAVGADRFLHEIRVTAGLSHPNIVPLYDSGEVDGLLYYVMPVIEGETLRQKLDREGPVGVAEAVAMARALADALHYAHGQGVVHRDVKPENILLHRGVPMLADFGIARTLQLADETRLTSAGVSLGTPAYMSPEQVAGDGTVGAASDIYSLATVVYEMLAGDPPFPGTHVGGILARILAEAPAPLRRLRPGVPVGVAGAVERALAKTPADRPESAAAFGAALVQGAAGAHASRTGPRRAVAVLAALAVVLLVVAGGRAWLGARPGPELSSGRLMIFPLVAAEADGDALQVGEDVATILGNVLDNTGAVRWVDAWTLLTPEQRGRPTSVEHDAVLALATGAGCGWLITGRVAGRGDSTQVVLTLHDTRGDSVVARGSAVGGREDAWRAGLLALNGLLPTLIPGRTADPGAEWRQRDPTAVARFLLGEAAFRRARMEEAWAHFREAVAADSTFALAAIRGALAASWNHRTEDAAGLAALALRHDPPARYAEIAQGYGAYLEGDGDGAVAAFERALEREPELAVTWTLLAEAYVHLLPTTFDADSAAEAALATAHRLDPEASDPLFHLIELRLRRGDTASTGPLVAQFLRGEPDSVYAEEIRLMDACVRGGPAAVAWEEEAAAYPWPLLSVSVTLQAGAAQLWCAEPGFRAILAVDSAVTGEADGRRWTAVVGLVTSLLARGEAELAAEEIDHFEARWGYGASLYLLGAPFVDAWVERARAIAAADAVRYGAGYRASPFTTRLWVLGVLEAIRGDPQVASTVAAELRSRAREGTARDSLLAGSLEGHAALARGDTGRAVALFEAGIATPVPGDELRWHEGQPLGPDRLLLARILHGQGEHRRAIEVASAFDARPSIYMLYMVPSLELRAEAAAAAGDARLEARYRARLAALRGGGEGGAPAGG